MEVNTLKELKCVRYLTKEMPPEDRSVFELELTLDYELQDLLEQYQFIWNNYPTDDLLQLDDHNPYYTEKLREDLQQNKRQKWQRVAYWSAAAVIIITAASLYFFNNTTQYTNHRITAKGERLTIYLPDSSKVMLNGDSRIEYPSVFEDTREVTLQGEAFFEVTKDKEHPFIVHSNELDVKVLGTSFSVNNKISDNTISLAEGKVEVLFNNKEDKVTLAPQEQLIWNSNTHEAVKRNFNLEKELAWKDNILMLDDLTFSNALAPINQFYGVNFKIDNEAIEKQRITGVFQDQNLEEFISSLEFITDVQVVRQSHDNYLIKPVNHD
ncbi:FecR domain-containing protein [Fulvivirga maritima]|uniref:FecR family protein n=1 Tax=Fulvivirga maritima TaxID=2904247 RepID=UPI001F1BFB29|nr:FecR domain-containing protein [Fulvivirga maritima]UII25948.1 FecR domain-containing protein [Fulvivirga maritima]